jgi:hypothetical protein
MIKKALGILYFITLFPFNSYAQAPEEWKEKNIETPQIIFVHNDMGEELFSRMAIPCYKNQLK